MGIVGYQQMILGEVTGIGNFREDGFMREPVITTNIKLRMVEVFTIGGSLEEGYKTRTEGHVVEVGESALSSEIFEGQVILSFMDVAGNTFTVTYDVDEFYQMVASGLLEVKKGRRAQKP